MPLFGVQNEIQQGSISGSKSEPVPMENSVSLIKFLLFETPQFIYMQISLRCGIF